VVVVQATVRMVMDRGALDEALRILQSIVERTRVEPGCVDCSIHRDTEDDRVIVFEQVWTGEQEMRRLLASDEYRTVLLLMEMCTEKPTVRFDTIAGSTGMETIESARGTKKDR
jgi:quinol monooxygenase YgiN